MSYKKDNLYYIIRYVHNIKRLNEKNDGYIRFFMTNSVCTDQLKIETGLVSFSKNDIRVSVKNGDNLNTIIN